jgi:hypothetical protein
MRFPKTLTLLILTLGLVFALSARAQQATHESNPTSRSIQKAHQVLPPPLPHAHDWPTAMQKVYMDESHCLTGPEIRGNKDNPISCYCRDAIADARYVHFTYLLPGKDANLYGTFIALQHYAGNSAVGIRLKQVTPTSFKRFTTRQHRRTGNGVARRL